MRFLSDNRAQSIQVGAVLLFGILIILLATWQAFVIPDQNEEIEFNQNQEVQKQMTELRTTVTSMPDAVTTRSATVDLGVRYPSRTIFRNPPAVSGTIQTTETTDERYNATIANVDPENENLGQFWERNGSSYNTGAVEYRPSYNEYRNAPRTIYAASVLYNKFDREQQELPVTSQSLIRDDRISLVTLNGSLRENRIDSTSVDFEPLSTQTREIEVESEGDDPITLQLPTRMSENRWDDLFADEANVENVSVDTEAFDDDELGLLQVELDPDIKYRLQMAKVGIGTDTVGTEAEYLTLLDRPEEEPIMLEQGEKREFTLEVRDEFNKALRGETVFADADNEIESDRQTRDDGQVRFTYRAESTGSDTVQFGISGAIDEEFNASYPEEIEVGIEVEQDEDRTAAEQLPGPKPENLSYENDEVARGETLNITEARFNNTGTTSVNRGGVPVTAGEYYVVEGDVEDPTEGNLIKPEDASNPPADGAALPLDPIDSEDRDLVASTSGQIETEELEPGEYTTFIRGQDTRGIWTNESKDEPVEGGSFRTFEILSLTVETNAATDVGATNATLNGELVSLGSEEDTDVFFEYREEGEEDWTETAPEPLDETGEFEEELEDLEGETTYEFRAVAESNGAADTGEIRTFTTGDDLPPAESALSNLDIAGEGGGATITEGDNEDVSVEVENVGDQPGEFTVNLDIENGDTESEQQTTDELNPGETETVTFEDVTGNLGPDQYDVVVSTEDDTITGDLVVEELTPGTFETLNAEDDADGGDRQVTFEWNIDGDFDEVIFEVYDSYGDGPPLDGTSENNRSGTVTLAEDEWTTGNVDLYAEITGPGDTEICTYVGFSNNDDASKDDFDCE